MRLEHLLSGDLCVGVTVLTVIQQRNLGLRSAINLIYSVILKSKEAKSHKRDLLTSDIWLLERGACSSGG